MSHLGEFRGRPSIATGFSSSISKLLDSRRRDLYYGFEERKNCSGASLGTLNGVADFGSGLNLAKTSGLSLKCFSSVFILVPFAGWSDKSWGICLVSAFWKS